MSSSVDPASGSAASAAKSAKQSAMCATSSFNFSTSSYKYYIQSSGSARNSQGYVTSSYNSAMAGQGYANTAYILAQDALNYATSSFNSARASNTYASSSFASAQNSQTYANSAYNSAVTAQVCVPKTVMCRISQSDLSDLAAGVRTYTKLLGSNLPSGSRVSGWTVGEGTRILFTDGSSGSYTMTIGVNVPPYGYQPVLMSSTDVSSGSTVVFPGPGSGAGPWGYPMAYATNVQYIAQISGSADLNTTVSGSMQTNVFYFVLP